MKNYLKFIPTIFILFGCSSESGVASLKKHNSIQIFPAHPSEQNYDYLVAMQNARTADLDLEQAESRSQALNYLMENVCQEYEITHQQTIDLPDLSSPLRDFKNYYFFITCDRP